MSKKRKNRNYYYNNQGNNPQNEKNKQNGAIALENTKKDAITNVDVVKSESVATSKEPKTLEIYVAGEYNNVSKKVGYGLIAVDPKKLEKKDYSGGIYGPCKADYGETRAVLKGMKEALKGGYTHVVVNYHSPVVESSINGSAVVRENDVKEYVQTMNGYKRAINIEFKKCEFVSKADRELNKLAHEGSCEINNKQILGEGTKKKEKIKFGNSITKICAREIEQFYQADKHTFEDYRNLKTYGIDEYEKMDAKSLEILVGSLNCTGIKKKLNEDAEYLTALRWCARGLAPEDAAIKSNVEEKLNTFDRGII